jgi:hypothetical protein
MNFPRFRRDPNNLIRNGMILLGVASIFSFLVSRQLVPETDFTDLVQGLLYGLCFGALLIGVWRRSRPQPPGTCGTE